MPAGRPSSYKPEYCDIAIELGQQGETLAGIAAEIGVHRETLNNWRNEYPEFFDALNKARAHSQRWWEKTLMQQAREGTGNATAAIFAMKNMFPDDYRDRKEHHIDAEIGVHEINFTGYHEDAEDSTEDY